MSLVASVLGGLGRARKVPRSGLWQLTSKRGPRNFYKGKGCLPTGQHTRKGVLHDMHAPCSPDARDASQLPTATAACGVCAASVAVRLDNVLES